MIAHNLDQRLVARTIAVAKRSGGFGWQKLRVALDSAPLAGAGRVEDTWNLIGRATAKVAATVSAAVDANEATIISEARLSALTAGSLKAALELDWDNDDAQRIGLNKLLDEVTSLETWVKRRAKAESSRAPLRGALEQLRLVVGQDIEPAPDGSGSRITGGTAKDRVISVGDVEMRHGRKSRSKRIDGYKRHIVVSNRLVLATAVEPANAPEHVAAEQLLTAAKQHGELAVPSPVSIVVAQESGAALSRPPDPESDPHARSAVVPDNDKPPRPPLEAPAPRQHPPRMAGPLSAG